MKLGVSGGVIDVNGSSTQDNSLAAEKARAFPQMPGVYLMKDAAGRVIYIGKAKNLRNRAGSYFLKAAAEDPRTAKLVLEIRDIDYIETKNEIDAILTEARLIKDILPKFNRELRDSKTFPYLEIHVRDDYPRVCFTRKPKGHGSKLYGPFPNPRQLRGAIQVLQKIFKFRTCTLEINADDKRWQWFRPCLLHSIEQCTAPCNLRISKEAYRNGIRRLQQVLDGKKDALLGEMREEMETVAKELRFEEAARLRDEISMLESLDKRGVLDTHVQPEVFPIDPRKGLAALQKILHLEPQPRIIEGVDVAHTAGMETVASVVQFIDGLPFKPGVQADAPPPGKRRRRFRGHPRIGVAAVPALAARKRNHARHCADRRRKRPTQCRPQRPWPACRSTRHCCSPWLNARNWCTSCTATSLCLAGAPTP